MRSNIFKTRHVAKIISVPDQDSLFTELVQIEKALLVNAPIEPFPFLKKGNRVRILSGPFKDIEGIVSRRRNKYRVVLNVTFIGRAVSLEIDVDMVEPIESA